MPDAVPVIDKIAASALRIPTDAPEADGTFARDHRHHRDRRSISGRTHRLGLQLRRCARRERINEALAPQLAGADAFAIPRLLDPT